MSTCNKAPVFATINKGPLGKAAYSAGCTPIIKNNIGFTPGFNKICIGNTDTNKPGANPPEIYAGHIVLTGFAFGPVSVSLTDDATVCPAIRYYSL